MSSKQLQLSFITLALLAATPGFAGTLEAAKAADLAMSKAVLEHDVAGFKSHLSPGAIFLSVPEPGPEAVAAAWGIFFGEKRSLLLQWEPDGGKASSSGDFAYTTGPYDYQKTAADGSVSHHKGRYLTFWQWRENRWQVWADGSFTEPTTGTPAAQLGSLWPPAGAPDVQVDLELKPIEVAKSQAGDLMVVVGELELDAGKEKAKGRYMVVAEPDGQGGWKTLAEGMALAPAP